MKDFFIRVVVILCCIACSKKSTAQKLETVYLDPKDSTSNFYVAVIPPKLPWTGYMFLIPGFYEKPQEVLAQTSLPMLAANNGILVIIPTFKTGVQSFGIDDSTQTSFREILTNVTSRFKLQDLQFFVGGFSIGGSCAVKFAELANQQNAVIKPKAVFAIDPPLDFERFYNAQKRNARLAVNSKPTEEAVYMIGRTEKEMKGTPENALANYRALSPYSFSDTTQTAIKNLLHTPIRLYSEPDINWWLKERGYDYSSINVVDCSAMINELNHLGNSKAALITTAYKGYRKPNNIRHPHSWSIAEPEDLLKWLMEQY